MEFPSGGQERKMLMDGGASRPGRITRMGEESAPLPGSQNPLLVGVGKASVF